MHFFFIIIIITIFIGQHRMKCEEFDKCKDRGAMVTSDTTLLTEQTSKNDFCINRITQLC